MGLPQTAVSFAVATSVCCATYAARHPQHVSLLYGVAMGALYAVVTLVTQALLLEREFSVRTHPGQSCLRFPVFAVSNARSIINTSSV